MIEPVKPSRLAQSSLLIQNMRDPFNPEIAIGKIVLTGPVVSRRKIIAGDHLPMEDANGYMIRAAQREVLGRYEDALSDYDEAIRLDPKNGDAHFHKGLTYVALQKKENAITAFEAAAVLFEQSGYERGSAAKLWIKQLQAGTH